MFTDLPAETNPRPCRRSSNLASMMDEELDLRSLERDVADFMGQHLYKPLKDLEIGKLLQQEPVFLTRDVNYCAIAAS